MKIPMTILVTAAAVLLAWPAARAQGTTRVSVDSAGAQGNAYSSWAEKPCISADGRLVAFWSVASNLVAGDTNGYQDVFVHDRQSGATSRVSVDSLGAEGTAASRHPSISADGRYVAFASTADNLVPGDTNYWDDVFVHDLQSGATSRVSVDSLGAQAAGSSGGPSLSADGRYVAFASIAPNLVVPWDTNGAYDVFVHDLQSGVTSRVSVDSFGVGGAGSSAQPSISADGRFVAFFSSASNLVPGDTNAANDVFVHDLQSGVTSRVSVDSSGTQGNNHSFPSSISADGRFVAFTSTAINLVAGDTNGADDVFVHDRQSGETSRVSVDSALVQGNGNSQLPSISADGRFVAFMSLAANLVPADTNLTWDILVRDRQSGLTSRVSVDSALVQANSESWSPSISADGRLVAFASYASNLVPGDTNFTWDVFVHDRGQPPVLASCSGDGSQAPCPCGNTGLAGRGCDNSAATGGAELTAAGSAGLSADTLVLTSSGELPTVFSIFLQGHEVIAPATFGDGLRCIATNLKRLYIKQASGGVASAPDFAAGDPPISVRSAAPPFNDPIPPGATRHYQTYYRDPNLAFCPDPPGNAWNVSNALSAVWSP